ncbi:MAG: TolC family protein [Bacteroidales bacterium]|nr:TolC family protein [Bacteroidales bacterium]
MRYISLLSIFLMVFSPVVIGQTISLERLFQMADESNIHLKVMQMDVEGSQYDERTARSQLLSSVNVGLSGSYTGDVLLMSRGFSTGGSSEVIVPGLGPQMVSNGAQPMPHWGQSFSVQASQVVFAGGSIKAGVRLAELAGQMAEIGMEQSRQQVRFVLTGHYLDLCRLYNQSAVVEQNIAVTQRLINNMRARCEQGTVLKNDITRYELQQQQLRLLLTRVQSAIRVTNHHIARMLDAPDSMTFVPDTAALAAATATAVSLTEWMRRATTNNNAMRQTAVATSMAEQQLVAAHGELLPSAAIVVGDNLFGPYTNDLIPVNSNVNIWFVELCVKYDLSSLWKKRHAESKAKVGLRQAQMRQVLAAKEVADEVYESYDNMLTAMTDVSTCDKQVQLAAENYDIVSRRYGSDLVLLTDMLDASNMKLSAEIALSDARINLLYAYYKLKYIAGEL